MNLFFCFFVYVYMNSIVNYTAEVQFTFILYDACNLSQRKTIKLCDVKDGIL